MGNEKHYDYYKTDSDTKLKFEAEYKKDIKSKRDEVFDKLQADTGCVAWAEQSRWGGGTYISELVFDVDSDILKEPYMKCGKKEAFEDKWVVRARGMGNRKLGKEFNAMIDGYNKDLERLPQYKDWAIEKLGIMRTGIGGQHSSGRGMAMLSTNLGNAGDIIVAAIPNNEDDKHKVIDIPECLEKITYGEFYDLANDGV